MRVSDSSLGISLVSLCGFLAIAFETYGASVEENIQAIKSVGKEGEKHAAAIAAVKELSQGSVDSLPVLLKSFEGELASFCGGYDRRSIAQKDRKASCPGTGSLREGHRPLARGAAAGL